MQCSNRARRQPLPLLFSHISATGSPSSIVVLFLHVFILISLVWTLWDKRRLGTKTLFSPCLFYLLFSCSFLSLFFTVPACCLLLFYTVRLSCVCLLDYPIVTLFTRQPLRVYKRSHVLDGSLPQLRQASRTTIITLSVPTDSTSIYNKRKRLPASKKSALKLPESAFLCPV